MTNHSASAAGIILACALFGSFLFYSCNSKPADTTVTDTTKVGGQPTSSTAATATPVLYLSSLTVSADVVKANKNMNIMFVYYTSETVWRLRGWLFKKTTGGSGQFNATPDMLLEPDGSASVAVGANTYLSNQVLTKDHEKQIADLIGNRKAKLHFRPIYDPITTSISYEITIEIITGAIGTVLDDTFSTNPTPPRPAFD